MEASQIAQMRLSTNLALSSAGATLSAENRRSRLAVRSPCWTLGSVLGGSIGFGGSGSTASARAGRAGGGGGAAAAARVDAEIGNRLIMGASLILDRGPIKTRFGRDSVPGTPAEAL